MGTKRKVPYRGGEVDAESVGFKTIKEEWSEYLLDDGSTVRIRPVPVDIYKTDEVNDAGDPLVLIQHQVLVDYVKAPEE